MDQVHDHHEGHDDHGGLHRDLPHLLDRRGALRWMGGMSLAGLLAACGGSGSSTTRLAPSSIATQATSAGTPATPTTSAGAPATSGGSTATTAGGTTPTTAAPGAEIPDEAAGPFPADGTNGPNVLTEATSVKADLTSSFGNLSGTAPGIPTTMRLTVIDADTGTPLPGAAVYLWHCTADGRYSIYEIADQNYLRGVQVTDAAGSVAFETVFPGCYPGRWPHAHFEVYPSLEGASAAVTPVKTSQLALPEADCEAAFADERYGDSAANLARLSLSTDVVFRDGWADQLAVVAGSPGDGYTASLLVRV